MREAKHATFGIFDIFAKDDASGIFFQTSAQCFVYRVADAVFPGRQDLFSDFLWRFCDVSEKLVGRRVPGFLRVAVLAANAFLDFIIDLREFLGGNHTFLNQLIFPAFQRIAFFELP